jgi:hypothetical protein
MYAYGSTTSHLHPHPYQTHTHAHTHTHIHAHTHTHTYIHTLTHTYIFFLTGCEDGSYAAARRDVEVIRDDPSDRGKAVKGQGRAVMLYPKIAKSRT